MTSSRSFQSSSVRVFWGKAFDPCRLPCDGSLTGFHGSIVVIRSRCLIDLDVIAPLFLTLDTPQRAVC